MVAGLDSENGERYLKSLLGKDIALPSLTYPGKRPDEAFGKSYGYGSPIRVDDRVVNGTHPRGHVRCLGVRGADKRLARRDFEFGHPADDVTCLTLNYVFFSMPCSRGVEGVFDPTQVNAYCGI